MTEIVSIIGARPQFIKAAVVSDALKRNGVSEFVVHTGQHYDHSMSEIFFEELGIREPDANLEVGSGSHAYQTGEILMRLERILTARSPDWVIVYGDTNSTLAGALAAAKLQLRVAHVEAGMRSYRRTMPEEVNRVVADHVSSLLFCATPTSVENLRLEGITEGVYHVGDVMYDALLRFAPIAKSKSTVLQRLGLRERTYALLTMHRAENVDVPERLHDWAAAIGRLDLPVVFPVHPRTRLRLEEAGLMEGLGSHVHCLSPLGYLDTIALEAEARVVLTDSGGVQREAYFLSTPSVILRSETEWPELVSSGASVLAGGGGGELSEIVKSTRRVVTAPAGVFGEGKASEAIAERLKGPANRASSITRPSAEAATGRKGAS